MTLMETIVKDLTTAMKEQDKFTLSVLRMLKSALQMEKISLNHELSDEEVITVIKRQVKQRNDSITEFTNFGRTEEVDNLKKEIECLSKYLPEELSIEKVNEVLDEIFDEMKPSSIKEMGAIMKEATARFKGQADMGKVSALVKERLS